MQVVDPAAPIPHRAQGITAAEQQVPGVKAKSDRGEVENLLDLPGGFDPGAGFVVEGGLITALATHRHRHLDALRELFPGLVIEAERAVCRRLAGTRPAQLAP